MKDKHSNFHDSIMKFKENHTKIKINKFEIVKIQEAVLHVLKLKDLNKLRDKFDGVVYYEKFLRDTICEIAIEKLLKKKIIDWESKKNKKGYKPSFIFNEKIAEIIFVPYEEYPVIINEPKSEIVFFCTIRGGDSVIVLGYLDKTTIEIHSEECDGELFVNSPKRIFYGFEYLKKFQTNE